MPGPLRRSRRLLALFLLLLTPAFGGWAVRTAHSCPTAAAGQAQALAGHRHHALPGHGERGSECHCIGVCHATGPARAAEAPLLDLAPPGFLLTADRPGAALDLPAGRPPQLLPPSTAPPVRS
ncbi:MAG TPA: hypothetical protein VF046_01715 [Gemmatimonadales bacterium]